MRVLPYKASLAVGDSLALDFLEAFQRVRAEGPVPPHFNEISRFFWQPRHRSSLLPEILPEAWKERGIEIIAHPLESENELLPLSEWIPVESLITFHLSHQEYPSPAFFQPLFRGRMDAEIFLIQSFQVLGAIGMIGSAIVFIKKEERAPISEFLESVLGRMQPAAAVPEAPVEEVPPTIAFEEAFDENDP
jgi:hypothetical protein